MYEINFSGDDLDADTLNSDEKQEGTVDETEAVADEQQLQRESTNQKQFIEKSSQTDEFDYLFTCSHEFTQTLYISQCSSFCLFWNSTDKNALLQIGCLAVT